MLQADNKNCLKKGQKKVLLYFINLKVVRVLFAQIEECRLCYKLCAKCVKCHVYYFDIMSQSIIVISVDNF